MLFQFLPRLSDDEYTALEKSIREHGVQVPITVDENRSIIDGHHRKEIAERLGIECPRRFAMDLSDEQKRTLALSLNLDRRHLNREQKRELVAKSLAADPNLSDRGHAQRTGVSHPTVAKVRREVESFTTSPEPATLTDDPGRVMKLTGEGSATDYRVNTETGEVSDDYLPDDAAGEEVTPSTEAPATAGGATPPADDVEEAPGEEVEPRSPEAPSRPAVTGIDGKTYTPREQKPRRKPITDAFFTASYDLGKRIESVHRLTEDDRFPQNAEKVAASHRNDLLRYRDLLEQVIDRLPEA